MSWVWFFCARDSNLHFVLAEKSVARRLEFVTHPARAKCFRFAGRSTVITNQNDLLGLQSLPVNPRRICYVVGPPSANRLEPPSP